MQGELQAVKQQLSSSAAEVERLTGDLAEARSEARGLTAQVASLIQKARTRFLGLYNGGFKEILCSKVGHRSLLSHIP